MIYYSSRRYMLAMMEKPHADPVLTCELCEKWYSLWLVMPNGLVETEPLYDLEDYAEGETAQGDHCWNPAVLVRLAEAKGWHIDDVSLDLITGRWERTMRSY